MSCLLVVWDWPADVWRAVAFSPEEVASLDGRSQGATRSAEAGAAGLDLGVALTAGLVDALGRDGFSLAVDLTAGLLDVLVAAFATGFTDFRDDKMCSLNLPRTPWH